QFLAWGRGADFPGLPVRNPGGGRYPQAVPGPPPRPACERPPGPPGTCRPSRPRRTTMRLPFLLPVTALGLAALAPAGGAPPADAAFFEQEVRPVLQANCLKCHGEGKVRGGLRLTSRAAVLKGGDTGPAVDLKNPDASLLLKAIRHEGDLAMPPTGRLPAKELAILERWVKAGVPWPSSGAAAAARDYWAYRPVS